MNIQELTDGLTGLGFVDGWAGTGNPAKITLWLHEQTKPSDQEIKAAIPQGAYLRECKEVERNRQAAYREESDPLFFKFQRNEDGVTKTAWLAKVEEIRERYPMPEQV